MKYLKKLNSKEKSNVYKDSSNDLIKLFKIFKNDVLNITDDFEQ